MNRATTLLASSGLVLALATLAGPTASAAESPDKVTDAPRYALAGCQNWTLKIAEGHASGTWCSNFTVVSGTVTDDKADGRCPYVRSHWSDGSVSDGPWIGPKNASTPFTLWAPSGTSSTQVTIRYVFC